MGEAGVRDKMVMLFGQMNEPPGVRYLVGKSALTMAEYFRDTRGQDVLVLIDNIFRFVQAGSELSAHVFSHLSASVVLSRKRASEGLYPAVDPLASTSVMLTPNVVGQRHYDVARAVRRTLAEYEDLRDIIAMLGIEELSAHDRAVVARARRLERFLTQPFFTVGASAGTTGRLVSIAETLDGCEAILSETSFDRPESAYYMIGSLNELGEAAA